MKQPNNYSQQHQDITSDIKLKNRDVELNFGKRETTPTKDFVPEVSPHKGDMEDEVEEEEKIDFTGEDFKSNQGPRGHSESVKSSKVRKIIPDEDFDPNESLQDPKLDNSENLFTNNRKIGNKTVEQLLIHNIDTSVKPIIGNRDIERQNELRYSLQFLTFEPWRIEDIVATIKTNEIESHLSEVYSSIAGNSPQEKIHALAYFESTIVNSEIANRLINSAFVNLFVKVLRSAKSTQIKHRLCSIIGLLVRHATIIENDRAELGICEALMEHVNDANEKVKRKAMAALGEYLFYAATQLDDEQADPIWEITDDAIT